MLLPVWLLAYSFRGKAWQVLINGQTGEVEGEAPVSVIKIALAVLLLLALAAGLVFIITR